MTPAQLEIRLGALPAGSQPVETSEAAADKQQLSKNRLRILRLLGANQAGGWTADELAQYLTQSPNQVAPRLTDLMNLGLAVKLDGKEGRANVRRLTRLQSFAFAYQITQAGLQLLAER